jgi:hypothetical protein
MVFDWALGRSETSRLSFGSFLSYFRLYSTLESVLALLAPVLITSLAFLVGRGIGKLVERVRR